MSRSPQHPQLQLPAGPALGVPGASWGGGFHGAAGSLWGTLSVPLRQWCLVVWFGLGPQVTGQTEALSAGIPTHPYHCPYLAFIW